MSLVSELISKITSCLKFLQTLLTFHRLILILWVLSNKLQAYLFKLYFPQIYAIICDCRIRLGRTICDISQANCRSDELLWRPRSCSWIFTDLFNCLNGTSTIFQHFTDLATVRWWLKGRHLASLPCFLPLVWLWFHQEALAAIKSNMGWTNTGKFLMRTWFSLFSWMVHAATLN